MINEYELKDIKQDKGVTIEKIKCHGEIPRRRTNSIGVIFSNEKLLVMGGNDESQELKDLYELDLKTLVWNRKYKWDNCFTGQAGAVVKFLDKEGLVTYGGFNGENYSDDLYLIDCNKNFEIKEAKKFEQKLSKKGSRTDTDTMKNIKHM